MAIHTVSDAVGVATVLYRGRDPSTPIKWQWWAQQLGPDKPLADVTPDDLDAGIKALLQEPRLGFRKGAGVVPQGNKQGQLQSLANRDRAVSVSLRINVQRESNAPGSGRNGSRSPSCRLRKPGAPGAQHGSGHDDDERSQRQRRPECAPVRQREGAARVAQQAQRK